MGHIDFMPWSRSFLHIIQLHGTESFLSCSCFPPWMDPEGSLLCSQDVPTVNRTLNLITMFTRCSHCEQNLNSHCHVHKMFPMWMELEGSLACLNDIPHCEWNLKESISRSVSYICIYLHTILFYLKTP